MKQDDVDDLDAGYYVCDDYFEKIGGESLLYCETVQPVSMHRP